MAACGHAFVTFGLSDGERSRPAGSKQSRLLTTGSASTSPSDLKPLSISEVFAETMKGFEALKVSQTRKIDVDYDPKHGKAQHQWPVRQKWIKELYEIRSAEVHRGPNSKLSSNWKYWQHMVIASFAYPLTVKVLLEAAGIYELTEYDRVRLDVLDRLLVSDWGLGWKNPLSGHQSFQRSLHLEKCTHTCMKPWRAPGSWTEYWHIVCLTKAQNLKPISSSRCRLRTDNTAIHMVISALHIQR